MEYITHVVLQASPESEGEKERKGREKEKDKENDKSRVKSRGESKQKSPKRKSAKEEVSDHFWGSICGLSFTLTQMCCEPLCLCLRVDGIRLAVNWVKESWRRGGALFWSSSTHHKSLTVSLSVSVSLTCIPVMCFCILLECADRILMSIWVLDIWLWIHRLSCSLPERQYCLNISTLLDLDGIFDFL